MAVLVVIANISYGIPERTVKYRNAHATTYAPGLMAQASRNRGLPIVKCMVSSPFHSKSVGKVWLWVKSRNTGVELLCRVTDTSEDVDIARHQRNRLFEFDFTSWKKLCGTKRINDQPWRQCKIEVSNDL